MTNGPLGEISTLATAQAEPARSDQVANNAGGYVFTVSEYDQLRRFLILGSEEGTYYANARDHSKLNAQVVIDMAARGDMALVDIILDVSLNGLAPRQQPSLFALAVAASSPNDALRAAALDAVPKVCRTMFFMSTFLNYAKNHRGFGRGLRRSVGRFFTDRTADNVAFQAVKYRQREGWSQRDLLRVAHPTAVTDEMNSVFRWITSGKISQNVPEIIPAFLEAQDPATTNDRIIELIGSHNLPWEAIPDDRINEPEVLTELALRMPPEAMLRQLSRFAKAGLLNPGASNEVIDAVCSRLSDHDALRSARLHPIKILLGVGAYGGGVSRDHSWMDHRFGGPEELTWPVNPRVVEALDEGFHAAFTNIEPTNKRIMVAVDVSGSMGWSPLSGSRLSAREISAAMAMATIRSEPNSWAMAFEKNFAPLNLTPSMGFTDAIRAVSNLSFGGTDCSLPMTYALENSLEVDTFIVWTDNETWAGSIHPHQALVKYRKASGIDAKLVVCAVTATEFTIADPNDPGMLDVVGFSADVPQLLSSFISS